MAPDPAKKNPNRRSGPIDGAHAQIGIAAHIDAARTTLTERRPFLPGSIHKIGECTKARRHDWMAGTRARHHDHLGGHDLFWPARKERASVKLYEGQKFRSHNRHPATLTSPPK